MDPSDQRTDDQIQLTTMVTYTDENGKKPRYSGPCDNKMDVVVEGKENDDFYDAVYTRLPYRSGIFTFLIGGVDLEGLGVWLVGYVIRLDTIWMIGKSGR